VFIIPGDNEWNDCSSPNTAWGHWAASFSRFEDNWAHSLQVARQSVRPENFAFVQGGVLFIGINLVGGRVHDSNEWSRRMTDDANWVNENFDRYGSQITSAVVFGHAFPSGARQLFGSAFVSAAQELAKPILYMQGDTHSWTIDHPFSAAPNITRVVVDAGVPSVRLTVNGRLPNPFQFDRSP
jgi:hypothetical protein